MLARFDKSRNLVWRRAVEFVADLVAKKPEKVSFESGPSHFGNVSSWGLGWGVEVGV